MSEKRKRKSFLLDDEETNSSVITNQKIEVSGERLKYRTVQSNSTKIEDEIRSHSELKKQYNIDLNLPDNRVAVLLNDLHYEFMPPVMDKVYEFVSKTEHIRNNIQFSLDTNGRLNKILNREKVFQNWTDLKENGLKDIDFIKNLKKDNPAQYKNILSEGDLQFATTNNKLELDYQRDLLYLVLFDKHIKAVDLSNIPSEEYIYTSQLFPKVQIPMEIRYDVIEENEKSITLRKVADSILDDTLLKKIEEQYNILHKPLIKYSFTEYKLTFRTRYTVDKNTRIINDAELTIIEDVEHNIQSTCKYSVRKL
ncbi:hypothetical protein J8L88_14955 [Aquimarina sp. MMG015]|uniref:hypothetical protein n=1 Tax=Aquimarina sp. MMG015 TaxID=2822689 RepID=UPI001B39E9CA|nr:hypothetical protein [Aquimarina sp. MMG015]MBQ4804160.1 hypothetical protein [Aquimarina sp. MMG015]